MNSAHVQKKSVYPVRHVQTYTSSSYFHKALSRICPTNIITNDLASGLTYRVLTSQTEIFSDVINVAYHKLDAHHDHTTHADGLRVAVHLRMSQTISFWQNF